jgi:hypothetical protein
VGDGRIVGLDPLDVFDGEMMIVRPEHPASGSSSNRTTAVCFMTPSA